MAMRSSVPPSALPGPRGGQSPCGPGRRFGRCGRAAGPARGRASGRASSRALGLALALALLPLAGVGPALADRAPDRGPATITVSGQGQARAVPDIATVSVGVVTSALQAGEAMAANAAAMQEVMAGLAAAGIAGIDIQTAQLSVSPQWQQDEGERTPRIVGYEATNRVAVRVRDLAGLGPVLDALVASGANRIDGLGFALSEPQPLQDAARKAAVEDAIRKATLMAGTAGLRLGPVVSISEGGSGGGPAPFYAARDSMAATPVAEGELSATASVSMTWELQTP